MEARLDELSDWGDVVPSLLLDDQSRMRRFLALIFGEAIVDVYCIFRIGCVAHNRNLDNIRSK